MVQYATRNVDEVGKKQLDKLAQMEIEIANKNVRDRYETGVIFEDLYNANVSMANAMQIKNLPISMRYQLIQ